MSDVRSRALDTSRFRGAAAAMCVWLLCAGGAAAALERSQGQERDRLVERFQSRADSGASFVGAYVVDIFRAERRLATKMAHEDLSADEFTSNLALLGFSAGVLLDREGRVVLLSPAAPERKGTDLASGYHHLTSALTGTPAVSDVLASAVTKEPIVAFALPVYSADIGVLSGGFSLAHSPLKTLLQRQPIAGSRGWVLDSRSAVIVSSDPGIAPAPPLDLLRSSRAGRGDAPARVVAVAPIPGTNWTYVLDVPRASLLAPIASNHTAEWTFLLVVAGLSLIGLLVTRRALDARSRARMESSRADRRLRSTMHHAPIGMTMLDVQQRFVEPNAKLCRMLGYSAPALAAMTFPDVTHAEDRDADLHLVAQLVAGDIESYEMEKRCLTAADQVVWVLLSVSLVRAKDGSPLYFIAQVQDITDSKCQRQALQDLTAMLAHDLRTPAAVVLGFAEELLEGPAGDDAQEVRDNAARICAGARAMTDLLDNALTATAVDSGHLIASPKDVSLRVAVATALGTVDLGAVSVDTSAVDDVAAWVDPVHLSQVITNLLTNAGKYGGDEVILSAASSQGRAFISIADNGPGVEPDFVPHLFDRFSRSTAVRSGRQRGSGLGLYIVRDLLAANGGTIRYVASQSGGANFIVDLGTAPPRLPQADSRSADARILLPSGSTAAS